MRPHREGNKVPKKEPGFVVFVLKPLPHARFMRRGADLVHKLTLPLYQALVGTAVDVQTLDHRCVGCSGHGAAAGSMQGSLHRAYLHPSLYYPVRTFNRFQFPPRIP